MPGIFVLCYCFMLYFYTTHINYIILNGGELAQLLYIHFSDQLPKSCGCYFDGIIQQVPLWDLV